MVKLQKTKDGQYLVTIPKQVVISFGWEKGQDLKPKILGENLIGFNGGEQHK